MRCIHSARPSQCANSIQSAQPTRLSARYHSCPSPPPGSSIGCDLVRPRYLRADANALRIGPKGLLLKYDRIGAKPSTRLNANHFYPENHKLQAVNAPYLSNLKSHHRNKTDAVTLQRMHPRRRSIPIA